MKGSFNLLNEMIPSDYRIWFIFFKTSKMKLSYQWILVIFTNKIEVSII